LIIAKSGVNAVEILQIIM